MSSSGLFTELKKHPWILLVVVLLHLGLVLLLGLNLTRDDAPSMPVAQKHNIIDAVVVDVKKYDDREKQKRLAAQKKIEDKKAAEKKRLLAIEQKKQTQKKRQAEKKKATEKKRQQELEKKKLAIVKKNEQERLKKEKQAKEKLVRERQAKEKLEREKLAAEKKRLEEKRLAEEKRITEEKRKTEEQRKRRAEEKAEFERALLEEERREEEAKRQAARTVRLNTQRQQYIMLIAQKVENSWLRPATTYTDQSCEVIVTQTMSGDVIDVQVQACTSDNAFQRSVERAVRKASPLPLPPDPELFDRKIYFTFKPR